MSASGMDPFELADACAGPPMELIDTTFTSSKLGRYVGFRK